MRADRGHRFFSLYLRAALSVCFFMLRSFSICVGCVCVPLDLSHDDLRDVLWQSTSAFALSTSPRQLRSTLGRAKRCTAGFERTLGDGSCWVVPASTSHCPCRLCSAVAKGEVCLLPWRESRGCVCIQWRQCFLDWAVHCEGRSLLHCVTSNDKVSWCTTSKKNIFGWFPHHTSDQHEQQGAKWLHVLVLCGGDSAGGPGLDFEQKSWTDMAVREESANQVVR